MSTYVGGLNAGLGAQHLGHYAGVISAARKLPAKSRAVVLLDDILAYIMFPSEREKVRSRTLFIASEYSRLGALNENISLVRASRLPHLLRWIQIGSSVISTAYLDKIYSTTYLGALRPSQRRTMGLPVLTSDAERNYPILNLPCLAAGVGAKGFFGSVEMDGYCTVAAEIWPRIHPQSSLPTISGPRPENVLGSDGGYMSIANGIFLSEPAATAHQKISEAVKTPAIRDQYARIFGEGLKREGKKSSFSSDQDFHSAWTALFGHMQKSVTSRDISNIEARLVEAENRLDGELKASSASYFGF